MRKFKRLTMTLALLITAVGGAWAQSSPNVVELEEVPAGWENDQSYLTPADLPGFKAISNVDEAKAWTGAPTQGAAYLIYAFNGDDAYYVRFDNGAPTPAHSPFQKNMLFGFSKSGGVKFYYPAEPTEWDLTSKDGKNWILDKMPASNIELQVEYFAESNLFLSKEAQADAASIAVKAGDLGVQFGNDGKSANTVTEGSPMTVTYNGTKKLLGMKVAKKSLLSIPITGPTNATIYYFEGETWEQALQNHPTENSAWKIDPDGYIYSNSYYLYGGGNLVKGNYTIDPNAGYSFPLM